MFSLRSVISVAAFVCAVALAGCDVKFNAGPAKPGDPNPGNPNAGNPNQPGQPNDQPVDPHINPKTKKDVADEQLTRIGGKVTRDKKLPGNPVVAVRIYSKEITDDDLKELASFKELRKLDLNSEKVTGTGFAALAGLPLQELHIMFAKGITDDGLKEIAKLKTLKVLQLPQGEFTDDAVKELAKLENLEELRVSYGVKDVGLSALKVCKKLRKVQADNCDVSDGAMKALSELPDLRVLILYGSKVTDLGYKYVGKMSKLEELRTSYNITDKGLAELGELKNLKNLNVWNSSVTMKGVRALPNLKNLKDLDISSWNIKPEEADKLRDELPNCNIAHKK